MVQELRIAVAGRGSMGNPLLTRLREDGYRVPLNFTRREVIAGGDLKRLSNVPIDVHELIEEIDPHTDGIDVMFLAVPSSRDEIALIDHCIAKGIYVILLCKHALAYEYAKYQPHRHMIGANATVGGRTMILPWLRMQYLYGRSVIIYAYVNASSNYFMQNAADVGSAQGAFDDAIDLRLAEPGSDSFVSFVNAEIGGDYPKKLSIMLNDAILDGGPFITPDSFERYIPLSESDVLSRTLPSRNDRYLVRIDNIGLAPEFPRGEPGSLFAQHAGFTICGGFHDMGRGDAISRWIKGGKANGVQVRFVGEQGYEGTVEIAGPGAGTATIGAAMNDLYEFQRARSGRLIEAQWPVRRAS